MMSYKLNRKTASIVGLTVVSAVIGTFLFFNGTCAVPQDGVMTAGANGADQNVSPSEAQHQSAATAAASESASWRSVTDIKNGRWIGGQGLAVGKFVPNPDACEYRIRYTGSGSSYGGSVTNYAFPSAMRLIETGNFLLKFHASDLAPAIEFVSLENGNQTVLPIGDERTELLFSGVSGEDERILLGSLKQSSGVQYFGIRARSDTVSVTLQQRCSR